jgi:beta-N-acetylhexosaminidase
MGGFQGLEPPEPLRRLQEAGALGGLILFSRNLDGDLGALSERLRAFRELAPAAPALVAVDQEGGRVARLGPPVLALPPARALGDRNDLALTERCGAVLGRQLRAVGFDVDFAPVLDVASNPDNRVIEDRAYGIDPERVAAHGLAFAAGLAAGGVLACGKHFPGHGDTLEDSHFELPTLPHDRARLDAVELAPFRAAIAAELPLLMSAHVLFPALDPDRPATLSRALATGLLRKSMGFTGVLVSDDLEMRAVLDHWSVPEAAVEAVAAGCDLLLVCHRPERLLSARAALASRAEADPVFAARLRQAAARVDALKARAIGARPAFEPAPEELVAELAQARMGSPA